MTPPPPSSTLFPYTDALPIFRQDSPFTSVYAVRSGSLKQVTTEGSGDDQLTNFYLPSELVGLDRKSTRLNSSHVRISYAVFCLKKKKEQQGILSDGFRHANSS